MRLFTRKGWVNGKGHADEEEVREKEEEQKRGEGEGVCGRLGLHGWSPTSVKEELKRLPLDPEVERITSLTVAAQATEDGHQLGARPNKGTRQRELILTLTPTATVKFHIT